MYLRTGSELLCFLFKIRNSSNICSEEYYFDPPYLISGSEYNKDWTDVDEISLYKIIDELASKGVRFGVTNLVSHKGKKNEIFSKWLLKYEHFDIRSNYISFNDNSIKSNTHEVYVTNVRKTN
jgi:DNA adenine methylase